MNIETLALYFASICHFGILIASATAPKALNWNTHLEKLPLLLRQMFWVYGVFIVLMIISFGTITLFFVPEIIEGSRMARAVCMIITLFWAARLIVQFFIFDAKPWLTNWVFKVGYHTLTLVFIYLTGTYAWFAFR